MTVRNTLARVAVLLVALAIGGCGGEAPEPAAAPAAPAAAPVALFIGDSYTEGTGLTGEDLRARWTSVVSAELGWKEVNAGCSGSGYVRRGLLCNNTFAERIPSVTFTKPDVVLLMGGVNDVGSPPSEGALAATDTLEAVVAAFPDARVVVISGITFEAPNPATLTAINQALEASAGELGVTYLDIGQPLAENPDLLGPDGLHPNIAGHAEIAERVIAALESSGYFSLG